MDFYTGTILLFAFPFAPIGWMSCEGQTLTINANQYLKN
jgi:microcystin-dependent protein